jgi:hypothetical protein
VTQCRGAARAGAGQPPLGLEGPAVLQVVAQEPTSVLEHPVDVLCEVDRVPHLRPVVVVVHVHRHALGIHAAIRATGDGEEDRRPEDLAVGGRERPADRAAVHLAAGKVRDVLTTAGRPSTPSCRRRGGTTAYARLGQLLVDALDGRLDRGFVVALSTCTVERGLELRPHHGQLQLRLGRDVRLEVRLLIKVPALPELRHPHLTAPLGARRAVRRQRVATGDLDDLALPGLRVDPAHRNRFDADTVLDRDRLDDVPGNRHARPKRPTPQKRRAGHSARGVLRCHANHGGTCSGHDNAAKTSSEELRRVS